MLVSVSFCSPPGRSTLDWVLSIPHGVGMVTSGWSVSLTVIADRSVDGVIDGSGDAVSLGSGADGETDGTADSVAPGDVVASVDPQAVRPRPTAATSEATARRGAIEEKRTGE